MGYHDPNSLCFRQETEKKKEKKKERKKKKRIK